MKDNKPLKNVLVSDLLWSNVGCEIILKGTVRFLENQYPNHKLQFYVPSHQVTYDAKLFSGIKNIHVIPMVGWRRYVRGALKKLGLYRRFWIPRFDSKYFRDADLFLSVGGDIYTMFSDRVPDDWVGYEGYATRNGIPSIMFGASMERFEVLSSSERLELVRHLNRFEAIYVRDMATKQYLKKHNIFERVAMFPDPIFSLRDKSLFQRNNIRTIGINFTPIMIKVFGQAIVDRFAEIVVELIDEGFNVQFIPHVYSVQGNKNIDDQKAITTLTERLPEAYACKVSQMDNVCSLRVVENVLSKVDLFIGGRMHGCLNALTLGKPVIFLGYSSKAATMVETLRREMPFKNVCSSFIAIDAGKINTDYIKTFIGNHNNWARTCEAPVIIDTKSYLDTLSTKHLIDNVFPEPSL
jgi:polysaccharide pyruvyl transferase WcaK-like protein